MYGGAIKHRAAAGWLKGKSRRLCHVFLSILQIRPLP